MRGVRDAAASRLRSAGQRVTAVRSTIVRVLSDATAPLTVPEICDAEPDLAQSSVYRNLAVLTETGVVHRIEAGIHSRFELADDLSQRHHHHLICTECGRVEDFEPGKDIETAASRGLAAAARAKGFRMEAHRLDVVGSCADCASM
ncbi:MAG: Fur family transcriptional regulator [Actinomycetota bacterium]